MIHTIKLLSPRGATILIGAAHITQVVGVPRASNANYEATVHTSDGKAVEVSQRPEEIEKLIREGGGK